MRRREEKRWRELEEFNIRQLVHPGLCFHTCEMGEQEGDSFSCALRVDLPTLQQETGVSVSFPSEIYSSHEARAGRDLNDCLLLQIDTEKERHPRPYRQEVHGKSGNNTGVLTSAQASPAIPRCAQ